MPKRRYRCALVAGWLLMAPRAVPAQLIEGPSRALGTTEDGQLRLVGLSQPAESAAVKDFLSDDLKDTLTDADRVSRVINSYLERTSGLEFLKDINFRLKTFHQDGGETNLGFSYAFSRVVKDYHFGSTSPTAHRGLDLSFNATGNVAFDRSTNPEDFLDTKLDLGFFQSTGGAGELSGPDKQKYSDMVDEIVSKYHAADPKVIRNSPEMKQVDELTRSHLTNQLALDFAGEAALESDQSFSKKQYVYGARLQSLERGLGLDALEHPRLPFCHDPSVEWNRCRVLTTGDELPGGSSGRCVGRPRRGRSAREGRRRVALPTR